jgi:hypothetical protein
LKSTILIVDDEPGVRAALGGVLRDEGYAVEAVASGEECLERVTRGGVDLILLDVWLPGLDGLATFQRLRGAMSTRRSCFERQHRVGRARDQDGRVRLRRSRYRSTRPCSLSRTRFASSVEAEPGAPRASSQRTMVGRAASWPAARAVAMAAPTNGRV